MSSRAPLRWYLVTVLAFATVTYGLFFAPPERLLQFAGREQILESLGALFLLAASMTCLASFWRMGRAQVGFRRRYAFLLLGLFFFVAFGEEVSWGQHIFGFQAPESFRRLNIQSELNIHNLRLLDTFTTAGEKKTGLGLVLNSNRLFDYFMITLFLVAPVAATYRARMRARLERLGVPLLPAAFGALLVVNFLGSAIAELFFVRDRYLIHLAVSEIRETNYALLCFMGSLYWFLSGESTRAGRDANEKTPDEPGPDR